MTLKQLGTTRFALPLMLCMLSGGAIPMRTQTRIEERLSSSAAELEVYIRHILVWPSSEVTLTIREQSATPFTGFSELIVSGERHGVTTIEHFFLSQDRQTLVRGSVFPLFDAPFANAEAKLALHSEPRFGKENAPVKIAEFSDFQCPFCRQQANVLFEQVLPEYAGSVALYSLDFPLEQAHPWARAAALMGRCVYRQSPDRYWDYYRWVFDDQEQLRTGDFKAKALQAIKRFGAIESAKVARCFDAGTEDSAIDNTIAIGRALKVDAIPTLFINGRKLTGVVSSETLKLIIDDEIQFQRDRGTK